jgi:hypothetical protein
MHDEEITAVRKVRHEISEECGHDVHKVAAYYRAVGQQVRRRDRQTEMNDESAPLQKCQGADR